MNRQSLPTKLAAAGALPFVACVLLLLLGINQLPVFGAVDRLMAVYGLVIATFMAGVHWGQYLGSGQIMRYLLWTSNAMAVVLWLCFVALPTTLFFLLLALDFIWVLWIDYRLYQRQIIDKNYWRLRWIVTLVVVFCLVLADS